MRRILSLVGALTLLSACHPAPEGAGARAGAGARPGAGVGSGATAHGPAIEAGGRHPLFLVGPLSEADINIQGCATTLERKDGTDTVFAEDGAASGAQGVIRLDRQLIHVSLVSASGDERRAKRRFADADQSVVIIEDLKTGASHQESDSVDQYGTVAVTYRGQTQTLEVAGGTAC